MFKIGILYFLPDSEYMGDLPTTLATEKGGVPHHCYWLGSIPRCKDCMNIVKGMMMPQRWQFLILAETELLSI